MCDRLERRRRALRAAAFCVVLALLCSCLLPAFAAGAEPEENLPGQTQEEDEPAAADEVTEEPDEVLSAEDGSTEEEETEPSAGGDSREEQTDRADDADEPQKPAGEPDSTAAEPEQYFETTYIFWLSEKEEADGGLPYAERTVGSGEELLMPEEPETEGETFRYWYSRDEEGTAVRFAEPQKALWPTEDGEQNLYAYFETATEEPAELLPGEEETSDLPGLTEEETETADPEADKENAVPEDETADEAESTLNPAEDAPTAEEDETEAAEPLAANYRENAAVFLLKSPTCLPGSNDPSQWAPDNSECRWIGQVNTRGAVWSDGGRNITDNAAGYVLSWPDGSTGEAWTLEPGDTYWNDVVGEIWDEYKASIEKATGITGLTQDDLESLTVTPYKISRQNNTDPDKHIDCTISVRSKKSFTARFNVRRPGEEDYTIVDSREYQSGERVEETNAGIEQEITMGGVRYVFDGWYKEISGPAVDAPGDTKVTQDQWDTGYLPDADELENGVVNFYAHYVLADMEPDTGVTLGFAGGPLMLGATAAVLGCKKQKKKEDSE